ncbi:MAG TPA: TlpA disulfide reductase family protein [Rhizomicrobium sp.]
MTLFRWPYVVLGAAVLSAALWAVLYGMPGRHVHAYAAPPASLAPFTANATPLAVPQVAFSVGGGTRIALSQLKGRYILLNLWAPWCAPCVRELPALARLQSSLPRDRFSVIAVDVGRSTASDARKFLDAHGSKALVTYVDSNHALLRAFGAYGLPLTILIDPKGREVGRALGAATWDSPEALDYFRALTTPRAAS